MENLDKYIDQVYHFKGKWGVPSLCGLKVIQKKTKAIVIATNLYESNPGTSISRWIAPLANSICSDFKIAFSQLLFIERNPDRQSKLEFYEETFDLVEFEIDNSQLSNPIWNRISKEKIDEIIG